MSLVIMRHVLFLLSGFVFRTAEGSPAVISLFNWCKVRFNFHHGLPFLRSYCGDICGIGFGLGHPWKCVSVTAIIAMIVTLAVLYRNVTSVSTVLFLLFGGSYSLAPIAWLP